MDASSTQWHVHKGRGGPVLVQYMLADQQQLELWVNPQSISEGGLIASEIFNDHEYLKHGVTLQPGDTILDIGANIGVFGARVLSQVPNGDVQYVGIEPCPQNYKLLQQNLLGTDGAGQQNSVFHINQQLEAPLQEAAADRQCAVYPGNVQLRQAAVSSSCGTCSITYYPQMPGNSTCRPQEKQQLQGAITPPSYLKGAQTVEVPVTTVPALLRQLNITGPIGLLKIDVEGEELQVLQGIDEATWDSIQQVALEVHDCIDAEAKDSERETRKRAIATILATPSSLRDGEQQHMPAMPVAAAAAAAAREDAELAARNQLQQVVQILQDNPSLAASVEGFLLLHKYLVTSLPGPRTCRGIDGCCIKYHQLPLKMHGRPVMLADGTSAHMLPPPRDGGRVVAVAQMLRKKGFTVVIECPLGMVTNYTMYGVRQPQED